MARSIFVAVLFSALSCAHPNSSHDLKRRGTERALFVGHTPTGETVVAAKHYDAMNGLAVLDTDLGLMTTEDGEHLWCQREIVTGSHYPQWICMYKDEMQLKSEHDRQVARSFLQNLSTTCTNDCGSH